MRPSSRLLVLAAVLLLGGCPPRATAPTGAASDDSTGDEREPIASRDRPDLRRAGVVAPGEYLFELADASGTIVRRPARLERFDAGALELV
ncbi:MAG: hypothetical protein M3Y87_30250, partial [Myxococcota bacterium]|nr:hypothetical protein [Myxococcota bacterium]